MAYDTPKTHSIVQCLCAQQPHLTYGVMLTTYLLQELFPSLAVCHEGYQIFLQVSHRDKSVTMP